MRMLSPALVFALAFGLAHAQQPDGLTVPPDFHVSVVTDGLGPVRHLAIRQNGDIYVSTLDKGIIALHLDADHKADQIKQFGNVQGGTGIRFYDGALYATSGTGVYRFKFTDNGELVPSTPPDLIVDGMPEKDPGYRRTNRAIAFDGKGNLYVALGGSANICTAPAAAAPGSSPAPSQATAAAPVGLKPCPDIGKRAGIWRFNATKPGQSFAQGEQIATGIRDTSSLDWSPSDASLYGIMHGRDNTNRQWPSIVSAQDEDAIADEMYRVTKGTNFGWPYTYYDGVKKLRYTSPEYGGDGRTPVSGGGYSTPALTFVPRSAPVDLVFYNGTQFPASYRDGAFIALHGTRNKNGYDIVFVPFKSGKAGEPTVFASGFPEFKDSTSTPQRAVYRPVGLAIGPHGALYVVDSEKGRIWRIGYGTK